MRRKEARVEVRMTEHEKEALRRKAAKNGMTVSEYARTLLANSDDATIRVIDTEPLRKAAHVLWVADALPELHLRLASVCRHAIISLSRMPLLPPSLLGLFFFYLRL